MKTLWPYYSTKKKAFFRLGKKRLVITKIGKGEYKLSGDKISKDLMWNIGETINLSATNLHWSK